MAIDLVALRRVAGSATLLTAALQTATAVVSLRRGRRDRADVVWGPGLAVIAVTGAVLGSGDRRRRWALAAATTGWAARLTHQIAGRQRGTDVEDPRYTEFLDGDSTAAVVRKVFVTQGLAQLLVSAPLVVSSVSPLPTSRRRWLFPAGVALMVGGAVLEAVADHQKSRHQQRGDDKPAVLDTGLWAWSRHPNYFGDSLVWDGAWLAAATSTAGVLTFPAPVAMSYLLAFATGARRTERRMQDRPGYRDYQRRVSFFVPRPPGSAG